MNMRDIGQEVLELFVNKPHQEFDTTTLIKHIYPQEYEHIKAALHDEQITSKETKKVAKRHKAQLHRRLLYHLNRLLEEETIKLVGIKGKGEKCYQLAKQPPTQDTQAPQHPLRKLEAYENKRIIAFYDQKSWYHRLNALLIDVKNDDDTTTIAKKINALMDSCNDTIAIWATEKLIDKEDLGTISEFVRKLDIESKDADKRICILIDATKTNNTHNLEDFYKTLAGQNPSNVSVATSITYAHLRKHPRLYKTLINSFSTAVRKINIHNKELYNTPIIIGKAGTYTLPENEWRNYKENRQNTIGLCIGQTAVAVDIQAYLKEHHMTQLRTFIIKIAQAQLESSAHQRRGATHYFKTINDYNEKPQEFFKYATNHIRLWNYDWQEKEQEHFIDLLQSCKEELNNHCQTQETIYKSCGMPIRFKTTLASTFAKFKDGNFTKRKYTKITIKESKQLQEEEFKAHLHARERMFNIFENNDRLRIFRTQDDTNTIYEEIKHLTGHYNIPLLTYDFAQRKENVTLERFMN